VGGRNIGRRKTHGENLNPTGPNAMARCHSFEG
jgi:hypothetical protein